MTRYYFIVVSKDFLFHQEPIEEIIRERINHYNALKKEIDFCVTTKLEFLNSDTLEYVKHNLVKPSAAIISLNPRFIDWLKLRIQYGIKGSFVSSTVKQYNCLFSLEESVIT